MKTVQVDSRLTTRLMALSRTASLAVILAGAILCARPNRGLLAPLTHRTTSSLIGRRLLLAALALSISLGWLSLLGQQVGLYKLKWARRSLP